MNKFKTLHDKFWDQFVNQSVEGLIIGEDKDTYTVLVYSLSDWGSEFNISKYDKNNEFLEILEANLEDLTYYIKELSNITIENGEYILKSYIN